MTNPLHRSWLVLFACVQALTISCWSSLEADGTATNSGSSTSLTWGLVQGIGSLGATNGTTNGTTDGTTGTGGTGGTGGSPKTCDDLVCRGHGRCEMEAGVPVCVCDKHYTLAPDGKNCIVDESCLNFRLLEDHCRQYYNGPPGVGLFFGLDFCAGTAVTPDKLEAMRERDGIDFQVLENDVNILENPESSSLLVPTKVESYVAIVLDVSKSVIGDVTDGTPPAVALPQLVGELRQLVASLEPAPGEAAVAVSIIVFARGVAEYVPFTYDFSELDTKLAAVQSGSSFVPSAVSIYGSELYRAVLDGLHSTQRIRDLRAAVSLGGILTTGTVVAITDGADQSGLPLTAVTKEIKDSLNQVISIGISSDVDVATLDVIGRDGSYQASNPADWVPAFAEVRERVKNYPKRAYLLTYCSARTNGKQEVRISLGGNPDVPLHVTSAECHYWADEFSHDPADADLCNAAFFTTECDTLSCGGLTACGACGDEQCCVEPGLCAAPATVNECDGQDELCHADDAVCRTDGPDPEESPLTCRPRLEVGDPCYEGSCSPGESYCKPGEKSSDPGTCVAVFPEGTEWACTHGEQCETLNCTQRSPDSDYNPFVCLPEAELHDFCGGGREGSAVCEFGGYCANKRCLPRKSHGVRCSKDSECRSGFCVKNSAGRKVCSFVLSCYWGWDEKIDGR